MPLVKEYHLKTISSTQSTSYQIILYDPPLIYLLLHYIYSPPKYSGKTTFLNDVHRSHKCTYIRQYHNLRPYIAVTAIPNFDPTKVCEYYDVVLPADVSEMICTGRLMTRTYALTNSSLSTTLAMIFVKMCSFPTGKHMFARRRTSLSSSVAPSLVSSWQVSRVDSASSSSSNSSSNVRPIRTVCSLYWMSHLQVLRMILSPSS